ncbi:Hypothetical protein PBC10988_21590 [Planctomycetales bacterium 10988]|nr:Hypothetical protein PBC10988_21590 [Planctomycetales bacterium 10988]
MKNRNRRFHPGTILWILSLTLFLTSPPLSAEETNSSLDFIPADAAVYGANLNIAEEWKILFDSNAWKQIASSKIVELYKEEFSQAFKKGFQEAMEKEGKEGENFRKMVKFFQSKQGKALKQLGKEMISEEIFLYLGPELSKTLQVNNKVNIAQYRTILEFGLEKLFEEEKEEEEIEDDEDLEEFDLDELDSDEFEEKINNQVIEVYSRNAKQLKIPSVLLGFQIKDIQKAKRLLDAIEKQSFFDKVNEEIEKETKGALSPFQKVTLGEGTYYECKFDVEKIFNSKELKKEFKDLTPKQRRLANRIIKEKYLYFHFGLFRNYLLISFSGSQEPLKTLGTGPLLKDKEELKPILENFDKSLNSMNYVSQDFLQGSTFTKQQIRNFPKGIDWSEFDEEDAERARKDLTRLCNEIASAWPELGANVGYCYRNEEGYATFTYFYEKYPGRSEPEVLAIREHLDGQPLIASAWLEPAINPYPRVVYWGKIGYGYFQDYILPKMKLSPREQKEFDSATEKIYPIVRRFHRITMKEYLPSLGRERAVAFTRGEPVPVPLPGIPPVETVEAGLIGQLEDADLYQTALASYYELFNDVIAATHQKSPEIVPDYQIPVPNSKETDYGTLYWYDLGKKSGLPPLEDYGLFLGIGEEFAVAGVTERQIQRLMTPRSLEMPGMLPDAAEDPAYRFFVMDWEQLIDTYTPVFVGASRTYFEYEARKREMQKEQEAHQKALEKEWKDLEEADPAEEDVEVEEKIGIDIETEVDEETKKIKVNPVEEPIVGLPQEGDETMEFEEAKSFEEFAEEQSEEFERKLEEAMETWQELPTEEKVEYVQKLMEFFKIFRGYQTVTYKEGDATVTKTQTYWQDVSAK